MPDITFKPVLHRNENRILVQFCNNADWNKRMKKVPGACWSKTLHGWLIPDTPGNRQKCGLMPSKAAAGAQVKMPVPQPGSASKTILSLISDNNKQQLRRFVEHLQLKAYSGSTIRTYRNEFAQLLQAIGKFPAEKLRPDDIRRYLLLCMDKGLKENTIHSRLNAIKFYYEQVLGKEKFLFEIPRPKKPLILPKLLNEQELSRLFNSLINKKHKAMLFTAYSAGLRVSEVTQLKLTDIDSARMQIFVRRAKGKKDRYVNLSPVLLDILRKYVHSYRPRPKVYLFESEQTRTAYPERTIQQIFMNAKSKAGIGKEVGIHSLRHSFATHLLEKGTDIKYIKDLLGHFDIRTTERYLHLSNRKLVNIISPFDDLWEKGSIEW